MAEIDGSEHDSLMESVDRATLQPTVRTLLNSPHAEVIDWDSSRVEGGFGHAYGVYRFQGRARVGDENRPWSVILKILGPDGGSLEPTDWDYWQREALVYRCGLLDDLGGGLVAPRCLDIAEHPGRERRLWLEDIHESGPTDWPLEQYGIAARHLGQFNGAFLAGKSLPVFPWLSNGQFRQRLALAEPGVAELPHLRSNPCFAGMSTEQSVAHSLNLWAEKDRLLGILDRLPNTICHHDAFRRNLFARDDVDGRTQTVAIDWAKLGPGVLGEELVALFSTSLRFVAVDLDGIADLDILIFDGYVDGLRDAGWQGDVKLARFGFTATAALTSIASQAIKWPSVAKRAAALPLGAEPPRLLSPGGVEQAAAVDAYLLKLGDEAYALNDTLSG